MQPQQNPAGKHFIEFPSLISTQAGGGAASEKKNVFVKMEDCFITSNDSHGWIFHGDWTAQSAAAAQEDHLYQMCRDFNPFHFYY